MTDPQKPYHVALSFMMTDMALARDLYQRLNETLSVFFFERRQEELTGRDGLEGFRAPFRDALVSVVLYRPPYGEANWTGVEKTAIGEACLKRGYKNLFVVMTDPNARLPDWIPATHIYFNINLFSVEELVGSIKTKVMELGGRLEPMTADKRAQQHVEEGKYQAALKRFHETSDGNVAAHRELGVVFKEVDRKCVEFAAKGIKIKSGSNDWQCVITNDMVTIKMQWRGSGQPGVGQDELRIEEYEWNMSLPGEPSLIYFDNPPRVSKQSNYQLELTMARQTLWRSKDDQSLLSSLSLADRLVIQFFGLADRVVAKRNQARRL